MSKWANLEKEVNKGVGADVITHLTDEKGRVRSGCSSGSLMLNLALSGLPHVGYAWGRIVELFGPEQSGKTTLALHSVAEAQKLEVPTMYIDAEHACDPDYMEAIGINLDELAFVQPDFGEQSLETVIQSIKSGYRLIVIDSVAALIPLAELEGDMGDSHMGLQARMMGQGMRKMSSLIAKSKSIVIFVNQIRMKIGVRFGNPETTTGGLALKFFASYRLEIRSPRGKKIEEKKKLGKETVEIGTESTVTVKKNKVYPPFRKAIISIIYGKGIDKLRDAVNYLEHKKLFKPDDRNVLRIKILDKSYTKNTLASSLKDDAQLKKAVVGLIKESVDADSS